MQNLFPKDAKWTPIPSLNLGFTWKISYFPKDTAPSGGLNCTRIAQLTQSLRSEVESVSDDDENKVQDRKQSIPFWICLLIQRHSVDSEYLMQSLESLSHRVLELEFAWIRWESIIWLSLRIPRKPSRKRQKMLKTMRQS